MLALVLLFLCFIIASKGNASYYNAHGLLNGLVLRVFVVLVLFFAQFTLLFVVLAGEHFPKFPI